MSDQGCSLCHALPEEMCVTASGKTRDDHKVRSRDAAKRISLDLEGGGRLDVSLSTDASPETIAALRNLGQAVVNRMDKEGRPVEDADLTKQQVIAFIADATERATGYDRVDDDGTLGAACSDYLARVRWMSDDPHGEGGQR